MLDMKLGHQRNGHKGQASWIDSIDSESRLDGTLTVIVKTDGSFSALELKCN